MKSAAERIKELEVHVKELEKRVPANGEKPQKL